MMRSKKDFDYDGIAAVGDYQYDDAYDKLEEIDAALKKRNKEPIPIKRSHGDVRENIGLIKYWDLDKKNKTLYVGWNREDLDKDIKLESDNGKFQVSIEYETEGKKIVGVNHIAVGENLNQKCPLRMCNIVNHIRDRSEEPPAEPDAEGGQDTEKVEVPEEPQGSEQEQEQEIPTKILLEKIELLTKQVEELSKAKDKPESNPEEKEGIKEKPKLGFQEKHKHELPSGEKPKKVFTTMKFYEFQEEE